MEKNLIDFTDMLLMFDHGLDKLPVLLMEGGHGRRITEKLDRFYMIRLVYTQSTH